MAKAKRGFTLKTVFASGASISSNGLVSDELMHAMQMLVIMEDGPPKETWDDEMREIQRTMRAFVAACAASSAKIAAEQAAKKGPK